MQQSPIRWGSGAVSFASSCCRITIEMSGLNAVEMSSLPQTRRTYVYRVQRRRPDSHEPRGTRSFARPARRAGRPTYPGGGCAACCGSLLAMSTDCCSACKQAAMPRSSMACGASLPTTANRRHSAAVCCNSTARTTLTSAPRSQLRNWLSAAWRCPLIPCGAGCSPKACGNASAAARRTAAAGHAAPASANWCRWTPRSTTGPRAAARTWF